MDEIWRAHRGRMVDLAFRMVGDIGDAEDIVQEAFARLVRTGVEQVDDVKGWLIVVVSRLCLDHLRSARSRTTQQADDLDPVSPTPDPADRVTLDDSIRQALSVVLEHLTPAERTAFILHDVFAFSFEAVAEIVGRTPAACRQLASRARRRVETETGPGRFDVSLPEQYRVAEQFIAAASGGDLDALVALLDEDVVGVAELGGGHRRRVEGRDNVINGLLRFFGPDSGVTLVSQPVDGQAGLLAFADRTLVGELRLRTRNGRVDHIDARVPS